MASVYIPEILKHCTLAIFKDGGFGGATPARFEKAFTIARARLVEYGFLVAGSDTGNVEKIRLTSKGNKRESYHRREMGGGMKSREFDKFFKLIEQAVAPKAEKKPGA